MVILILPILILTGPSLSLSRAAREQRQIEQWFRNMRERAPRAGDVRATADGRLVTPRPEDMFSALTVQVGLFSTTS